MIKLGTNIFGKIDGAGHLLYRGCLFHEADKVGIGISKEVYEIQNQINREAHQEVRMNVWDAVRNQVI